MCPKDLNKQSFLLVTKKMLNVKKTGDDYKKSKFDHGRKLGAPKNAKFV